MRRALPALVALALAAGSGAGAHAAQARLEPIWTLTGLEDPESVALSADGTELYVTNVAGEGDAKDGRGFISRVSLDGRLIEKAWVAGLDGPKGAAVAGDRLYVSDITRLAVIDTRAGRVVATHEAPGAGFLNDVAITPGGLVLVADSARARIYRLQDGVMTIWAEAPALAAVNGLLPEPERLVVTTMAGKLLAMDYRTQAITVLAEGLGDGDGAARLDDGSYLVSEWPGRLFQVAADGEVTTLIDSRPAGIYINDFIRLGERLIVPNWKPGSLTAYRIR